MRIEHSDNTAFSLLEILLAAVIFVISVAGIFSTLSAVRTPVNYRENSLTAAVFGKQVLEALRSQVNAGTGTSMYYGACSSIVSSACVDFSLYLGLHHVTLPVYGINWPSSALSSANSAVLTYTVSCADGVAASGSPPGCSSIDIARRVDLNINWPNAL